MNRMDLRSVACLRVAAPKAGDAGVCAFTTPKTTTKTTG
jgi:hypothetical protein